MQLFQFLHNKTFHELLLKIDRSLAQDVLEACCQYCEGNLHVGDYPRQPHGLTSQFRDIYAERLSFCCAKCKKRNTPPSVIKHAVAMGYSEATRQPCMNVVSSRDNGARLMRAH